jgi:hypothetical protein
MASRTFDLKKYKLLTKKYIELDRKDTKKRELLAIQIHKEITKLKSKEKPEMIIHTGLKRLKPGGQLNNFPYLIGVPEE